MHGIIDFAPDVDTLPHALRVFGFRVANIEAHLDVLVLGPVFDDPPSQVVSGPFELVFEFGRVLRLTSCR